MLSFSLADTTDSIDATDTCTPGSPNYIPGDPICALYPGATPDAPEIQFNPESVRTSCPPGFNLVAGTCIPMNAAASSAFLAVSSGWGPIVLAAGAIGAIYGITRHMNKRKRRG